MIWISNIQLILTSFLSIHETTSLNIDIVSSDFFSSYKSALKNDSYLCPIIFLLISRIDRVWKAWKYLISRQKCVYHAFNCWLLADEIAKSREMGPFHLLQWYFPDQIMVSFRRTGKRHEISIVAEKTPNCSNLSLL